MKYSTHLGVAVAAVGEQAVVAHADADVRSPDPEDGGADESFPREHEERCDGQDVEDRHEDDGDGAQGAALCGAAEARPFLVFGQIRCCPRTVRWGYLGLVKQLNWHRVLGLRGMGLC